MENNNEFTNSYQKLIIKQELKGIIKSIPRSTLNKAYQFNIINNVEYEFYKKIYKKLNITDKQNNWKKIINDKIIKIFSTKYIE